LNVPNVKSAKKRVKTNEKRRQRNRTAKAALKTHLKRIASLDETKDAEAVKQAALQTLSLIGKTRSKGIVNRRKSARLQSRVQRKLNQALEAGSAPAGESDESSE
jgi:small subunit ribosomal protein S20